MKCKEIDCLLIYKMKKVVFIAQNIKNDRCYA